MIQRHDQQRLLGLAITVALLLHSAAGLALFAASTTLSMQASAPMGFEVIQLAHIDSAPPAAIAATAPVPTPAATPPQQTSALLLPELPAPDPIIRPADATPSAVDILTEPPEPQVVAPEDVIVAQEAFSPSTPERANAPSTIAANSNPPGNPAVDSTRPPLSNVAYLNNAKPLYPHSARRRKLEGTVLLEVNVSALGEAKQVEVKQSSGHNILDLTARNAVEKWRFIPAEKAGIAVAATVEVPIRFALNN